MAEKHPSIQHRFAGGWSPDYGFVVENAPQNGVLEFPWLVNAENIQWTLDGGWRKFGGADPLNASALESGAAIMGLFDYWKIGTGGSPTQKRVIHVGTKIKKDDADGLFTDVFTGLVAGAIPAYAVFDDYLIAMSNLDVPRFWDQSTAKVLGTNTPNGSFGVTHANRFWMAGDPSAPSRLFYSPALPSGADGNWFDDSAGLLDIDPGDGDEITGLASYKEELWVFKGPNLGSIHRVSGASPATFARKLFIRGVGAVAHNSIFPFGDDIGFMWADGSVRSLVSTAAFGDFKEGALSLPLNEWLRDHARHDRLPYVWAKNIPSLSEVSMVLSVDTSTRNNVLLAMDYRFSASEGKPRWSQRPAFGAACVAPVIDSASNKRPSLFTGGYDGFVRKLGRAARSIDGTTAYSAKLTTPFTHYGDPVRMKTLGEGIAVGIVPRGSATLTARWRRDDQADQSTSISQAGADAAVLAPATSPNVPFQLDVSRLAGSAAVHRMANVEEGGEFRQIQYEFVQGGNNEDVEMHSFTVPIEPGAASWEN